MPTLYKHYDEAAIAAIVLFFGFHLVFISKHTNKVYLILMMSAMLATLGTSIEILVSFGTKLWLLNFVLSIWWLWYLDQNNIPLFFTQTVKSKIRIMLSCFFKFMEAVFVDFGFECDLLLSINLGCFSAMISLFKLVYICYLFFRYQIWEPGSSVCRYLWNSNQVYLMAQWEEICGLVHL